MDAYDGVDLQVGEITAVRTFRIGPAGALYPLFSDVAWTDGVNTAQCRAAPGRADPTTDPGGHTVPAPDCTCGFYAYASEAAALEYAHARYVLAVVSCWGQVSVGTRGLRAEHARIDALWTSDAVPADLVEMVANRYGTVEMYTDKDLMLTQHPLSVLDCYQVETERERATKAIALRIAVVAALVLGLIPPHWISGSHDARMVWAAELGFFVVGAVVLRSRRTDLRARRRALLFVAVALWLLAPFAGVAATALLRLPMLQIVALMVLQRRVMAKEASRFPAVIRPVP